MHGRWYFIGLILSLPTGTQPVLESRLFLLAVLTCVSNLFEPPRSICNKADDDTGLSG